MTGRLRRARIGSADGARSLVREFQRDGPDAWDELYTDEAAEQASMVYDAAGRARKKIKIRSTAKANSAAIQCR